MADNKVIADDDGPRTIPLDPTEQAEHDQRVIDYAAGAEQRARNDLQREVPARVAVAERNILRNEILLDPGPNAARKVALKAWLDDIENFPLNVADPSAPGLWPVKPA